MTYITGPNIIPHLIWDIVIFGKEHLQLANAYLTVTVGEFVWYIKAERSKLTSLNQHSVEEAQRQQQVLEVTSLRAHITLHT